MEESEQQLPRKLGLMQAVALNMIDMVGIGPFVVLASVIGYMNGPQAILAWIAGATLSLLDATVWSELGAKMPQAGGSYVFLRELYGKHTTIGKLLSFLLIWQTMFQAPLVLASGAIGFSEYALYLYDFSFWEQKAIAGSVVLIIVALLYRRIESIGKLSVILWVCVIGTIVWLIGSGINNFSPNLAFTFNQESIDIFSLVFWAGLGQATVKTMYSYLGYYNVCHLGAEIRSPESNIPRSMFISIIGIAFLYSLMHLSIVGVIPWQEAKESKFVASLFFEKIYGHDIALIATGLILIIAFSSLYAVLLGYSRIPYAAALDGNFFKIFAKLHPTKKFPYISLISIGVIGFIFSLLFKLKDVISAILAMRIIIQFIGQAVGLILWKKQHGSETFPWKMWLYPLPVIIAILAWIGVFFSTGTQFMYGGLIAISLGIIVYYSFLHNKS